MPHELAESLLRLEPRLSPATHSDSWALSWMLAVGATYSLARAKELLPGEVADFRHDALAVIKALAEERAPDAGASPTWLLGFYLNSTEARIQSAVHRVLRAFSGMDGNGPTLITVIEGFAPPKRPPEAPIRMLAALRDHLFDRSKPSTPLARIWIRTNSVKHDPAQDVSDQFNFGGRWTDCRAAIGQLIQLIESLGTHGGAIRAAA